MIKHKLKIGDIVVFDINAIHNAQFYKDNKTFYTGLFKIVGENESFKDFPEGRYFVKRITQQQKFLQGFYGSYYEKFLKKVNNFKTINYKFIND